MKKIITALGNQYVNNKLKEYEEINVIVKDIQYKEGIIEILEQENNIDYIIISELLPGEIKIEDLINLIKEKNNKINIITILDKENKYLENKIKQQTKIFFNNQIKINELAELIINKNNKEELKEEIRKLNKIIEEKNIELKNKKNKKQKQEKKENKYKKKNKIIKFINNKKIEKNKEGKIIVISGLCGIGKSIFTVNLAKNLQKNKKKILIIDLDIFNNSIYTLFGIEKYRNKIEEYEKNKLNINEKIININKYIKILSGNDIIFSEININEKEFANIIEKEKKNYDAIIIDTTTELKMNYIKEIMKKSDKIIFLSEANILQIKKTNNYLNIYQNNWKINKEKINIIFNKTSTDSIDEEILKEIFKDYKIIGIINQIKYCNTLINNNMKNIFINNKVKKQYESIKKKIFLDERLKIYYFNKINQKKEAN